ncbi:MAG: HWE histidine kinase domain-containing protein, partial [Tistlia sp.]
MDREGAYDFGRDGVAGAEPGKSLAARALESEERLQLALEAGRMGTWEWEVATSRVVWSAGLEEIHGLATGSFAGTFEAFQEDIHPEDRERVLRTISGTVERGDDHHIEYRILLPDGSLRWVEGRGRLFRDEAGAPARMIGVCLDVTERKENEQRRALLLDEFSHRIKNIMAIVQSIAGLTLRETPEPEAFKRAFQSRLAALDTAHSLLTRQQWRGACLTDLVAGTLAPFGGG